MSTAPSSTNAAADADAARSWLTPGVRGIGAASLLADVGHEIPTSLLPSLLTGTLGAPAAALGLIEGVADGVAGAARFGGGALADDPQRRRRIAVGGYASTAILSGLIGMATTVWQVAILRSSAWAARGLRVPARNALLADVVAAGAYGRAYGFERMMDNLGAILGPLLGIALVAAVGVRGAILLSIIPGLLAVGAIVYAIRAAKLPTTRERQPIRIQVRPVLQGELGRLLGAVGAFELGNIAATLLILRATDLLRPEHGADSAAQLALALYTAYNIAATIVSVPAGRHGDRRQQSLLLAEWLTKPAHDWFALEQAAVNGAVPRPWAGMARTTTDIRAPNSRDLTAYRHVGVAVLHDLGAESTAALGDYPQDSHRRPSRLVWAGVLHGVTDPGGDYPERGARKALDRGRRVLSALGAWPWTCESDGALHGDWWTDGAVVEALNRWRQTGEMLEAQAKWRRADAAREAGLTKGP